MLEYSSFTYTTGNPTCKQKFDTGYTIEDFDEILAAIWKYIKEQE